MLKVDPWLILPRGNEGFGGFEADRLRDRILCTQRTWRGRGRDFIYTKNVARPRSAFYLRNEFRAAGVRCGSVEMVCGVLVEWQCIEDNNCYSEHNFRAARFCASEVSGKQRVDIGRPTK